MYGAYPCGILSAPPSDMVRQMIVSLSFYGGGTIISRFFAWICWAVLIFLGLLWDIDKEYTKGYLPRNGHKKNLVTSMVTRFLVGGDTRI